MAKPLHPPAQVSLYGLVYILLSLQIPWNLTDGLSFTFSGLLIAPLLAAWLGWRFGKRGLLPLWLSAPVTLPYWSVEINYSFEVGLGLGLALFALCVLLTLVFAARRAAGVEADQPQLTPLSMAIAGALLLLAAGHLDLGLDVASSRVSVKFDGPWGVAVAAFGLVLFRRVTASFVAAGVCLVSGAGFVVNQFSDVFVSVSQGAYAYELDARAGWGKHATEALSFGLAAILAGVIVRDWRSFAALDEMRGKAKAGLAVLLLVPFVLLIAQKSVTAAMDERPQQAAMTVGVPVTPLMAVASLIPGLLQMEDEVLVVTVTASRRQAAAALTALGHPVAGHLLALFSLILGASIGPRGAFWLPQGVVLVTLIAALGLNWAEQGEYFVFDSYFAEEFVRENVSGLIWAAFACWSFAWVGMRQRVRANEAEGSGP